MFIGVGIGICGELHRFDRGGAVVSCHYHRPRQAVLHKSLPSMALPSSGRSAGSFWSSLSAWMPSAALTAAYAVGLQTQPSICISMIVIAFQLQ